MMPHAIHFLHKVRFLVSGITHQAAKADHINIPTNISGQYKTYIINLSNSIQTYLLTTGSKGRWERRKEEEEDIRDKLIYITAIFSLS